MTSAYNAYRVHALGPNGMVIPECVGNPPKISGRGFLALAAASLLLKPRLIPASFFGFTGEDAAGSLLRRSAMHLPWDLSYFRRYPGPSPQGLGENAEYQASKFLRERAEKDPEWPEAACTQATWVLFDIPAQAGLPALAAPWVARARRRKAFTAVWLDAEGLAKGEYPQWPWEDIDLLILTSDREVESPCSNTVFLEKNKVRLHCHGGIFGRSRGEIAWDPNRFPPAWVGALIGRLMLDIWEEDDIPRSETHVERERLWIQPLHLVSAAQWAKVAVEEAYFLPDGMIAERDKGSWLETTKWAWSRLNPEKFRTWGGRHEPQRR